MAKTQRVFGNQWVKLRWLFASFIYSLWITDWFASSRFKSMPYIQISLILCNLIPLKDIKKSELMSLAFLAVTC